MENIENENRRLKFLIVILLIVLLGIGCYHCNVTYVNVDKNNNKVTNDDSTQSMSDGIEINEVTFNNEKLLVSDMIEESIHISSLGIESVNPLYNYDISLLHSGKVKIYYLGMSASNSQEYKSEMLSNVSDVTDIIQLNVAGDPEEQLIYMLLSNGDVYYYKIGDCIQGNYTATKVDNVSNVKKLFVYNYPARKSAGGSWAIVAIKDNNETVALKNEGV